MKLKYLLLLFGLLCMINFTSGQKIHGFVYDKDNREPLIGVTIFDTVSRIGIASNEFGYFSFLSDSRSVIEISYLGYKKQFIQPRTDSSVIILLCRNEIELENVVVSATKQNYEGDRYLNITVKDIEKLPALGGEKDPLKYIATLSGVNAGREGQSAYFVRGGGLDQNAVILDGAPIYGTGHFFSFVSLINPDALKSIQFYKGDAPANIGGKISSTADISFKEGSRTKFSGKFDVGLVNSKVLVEGPLSSKASFMIAARSSYLELLNIKKRINFERGVRSTYEGYTFFDVNAKVNFDIKPNEKAFLNFYYGGDLYSEYRQTSTLKEQNFTKPRQFSHSFSLKYLKEINKKYLFSGLLYTSGEKRTDHTYEERNRLIPSAFNPLIYELTKDNNFETSSRSSIQDLGIKLTNDITPNSKNYLRFGIGYIHHFFDVINTSIIGGSDLHFHPMYDSLIYKRPILGAAEFFQFIQHTYKLNKNIELNFGIRNTYYAIRQQNLNRTDWNFSLNYAFKDNIIKLTVANNHQFTQGLLQNESLLDRIVWIPSTTASQVPNSRQITLGFYKKFPNIGFNISAEGFYKELTHLTEFEINEFYSISKYNNWEDNLIDNIRGRAYGVELNAEFTHRNLSVRFNHTLAKSERKLPNGSDWYPFKFDLRNSTNLNLHYEFGSGWNLAVYFLYNDGIRMTIPTIISAPNPLIDVTGFHIEKRNNFQLPANHRLDLSISKKYITSKKREIGVGLSIYNLYNRQNASFASFRGVYDKDTLVGFTLKKVAILPFLPALNYTYKF